MSANSQVKQTAALFSLAAVVLAYLFCGSTGFLASSLAYAFFGLTLLFSENRQRNVSPGGFLIFHAIITQSFRSLAGILLALAFAVAIFGWFADGVSNQNWEMALGALVFAAGTVVWASWLAPSHQLESEKTTLITGLSALQEGALDDFKNIHSFEEIVEAACKGSRSEKSSSANQSFNKSSNLLKNRLTPILTTLAKYKKIKQVRLITFEGTLGNYQFGDVRKVIQQVFPGRFESSSILEIRMEEADHWDAEKIYEELLKYIHNKDCDVNQTIIALTNGTAALTAALTLIALEGDAHPVYFKQNDECNLVDRVVEFKNWNVKRVEHLFSQLLEAIRS